MGFEPWTLKFRLEPLTQNFQFQRGVKFEDDGEFDIIESEPDSVSSSSEEEQEVAKKVPEKPVSKPRELTKKEQEERLKKISEVKIGFKEFLQVLDYRMLGIFFKSIIYYFIFAFFMCGIYLICIYNFNQAMWHEYFPVQDLSDEL